MKITVEMSPKEARSLAGLPDMDGVWEKVFADGEFVKTKMTEVVKNNTMRIVDPFNIMGWREKNEKE